MPKARAQIKVAIGTVEVTDTDRRAIAWEYDGDMIDGQWVLNVERRKGYMASHDDCRRYLRKMGEHGLYKLVIDYLNAGGLTASQE
jgi:nitrogen fixation protein FixH